jgi:hypothetical protein
MGLGLVTQKRSGVLRLADRIIKKELPVCICATNCRVEQGRLPICSREFFPIPSIYIVFRASGTKLGLSNALVTKVPGE